ncbi:hypothetical protein [Mycetocola sp.]|uniref:hypothetical protein n=1 Tax=Mycetocola sp. TaxID=1871042 RepID=UPI003989DF38
MAFSDADLRGGRRVVAFDCGFHPESRVHLPVGAVVDGEFHDGAFVDRSVGIAADPRIPALAVLAFVWVFLALALWANAGEARRLKPSDRPTETVLAG